MDLRYVGNQETEFLTANVGLVKSGDEFSVPDDVAEQFLRRSDIEEVNPVSTSETMSETPASQ